MSEKIIPWSKVLEAAGKKSGKKKKEIVSAESSTSESGSNEILNISKYGIKVDLIWLLCPKCATVQYTLTKAAHGRTHNRCGSEVIEHSVKIDVAFEYKAAEYNRELAAKLLPEARGNLSEEDFADTIAMMRKMEVYSEEFCNFILENFDSLKDSKKEQADTKQIVKEALSLNFTVDKWGFIYSSYAVFMKMHNQ